MVKQCMECGRDYESKRSDSKTCSLKCRVALSRSVAKETENVTVNPDSVTDSGSSVTESPEIESLSDTKDAKTLDFVESCEEVSITRLRDLIGTDLSLKDIDGVLCCYGREAVVYPDDKFVCRPMPNNVDDIPDPDNRCVYEGSEGRYFVDARGFSLLKGGDWQDSTELTDSRRGRRVLVDGKWRDC